VSEPIAEIKGIEPKVKDKLEAEGMWRKRKGNDSMAQIMQAHLSKAVRLVFFLRRMVKSTCWQVSKIGGLS
jgi:hypothetical protein